MLQTATSAEGLRILSQGEVEGARAIFERLVADKTDLAQANYGLGVIALQERNPSLARDHFEACLWHDAQHANALYQLGVMEKQSGNRGAAIQYWERSLAANPSHAGAIHELNASGARSTPPHGGAHPGPQDTHQGPPPIMIDPRPPVEGYDLYGLLKRSSSGVETEMVRLLDEVQEMMVSTRQGVKAFIGWFIGLWIVGLGAAAFLANQRDGAPIALGVLGLVLFVTLGRVLEIKCNKIDCDRYVFVQQKGVFATRARNDHLWLMSHEDVLITRTLLNRLTNDGTLHLGAYNYRGFFSGHELRTIQKNFAQLRLLMPTNREVLAAIGELKNMRTGDK
jgi:tetratricopeptide (TPR) repeat protein